MGETAVSIAGVTLAPTSSRGSSTGSGGNVQLDYVERTTTFSGAGTILTSNSVLVTAGMIVLVEFGCAYMDNVSASGAASVNLLVDATARGNMGYVYAAGTADQRQGVTFQRQLTGLSVAAHTFSAVGVGSGANWFAGDGSGAGDTPIYLRVSHLTVGT